MDTAYAAAGRHVAGPNSVSRNSGSARRSTLRLDGTAADRPLAEAARSSTAQRAPAPRPGAGCAATRTVCRASHAEARVLWWARAGRDGIHCRLEDDNYRMNKMDVEHGTHRSPH